MSIFEKLKNALFEEEYVEVDEKPKVKSVPKKKVTSKEKIKEKYTNNNDDIEEEKPVAKKVVLPEKKEVHIEEDLDSDEEEEEVPSKIEIKEEVHSSFKIMDDDDFKTDYQVPYTVSSEPKIVKVIDKDDSIPPYSVSRDSVDHKLYPSKPKNSGPQPYGIEETPKATVQEYNSYEQKDEKSYFKPSPIISPIYGILDKNYSKDDIVPKREIKFTSSFVRDKVSVDDVREKAFGKSEDEAIHESKAEVNKPTFEVEDEDNLFVDLSSDTEKPAVKDVTMGDALEYFHDLGLEYNVDYVDAGKKTTSKREKDSYDEVVEEKPKEDVTDDDNLFDLIDSMYQEQD